MSSLPRSQKSNPVLSTLIFWESNTIRKNKVASEHRTTLWPWRACGHATPRPPSKVQPQFSRNSLIAVQLNCWSSKDWLQGVVAVDAITNRWPSTGLKKEQQCISRVVVAVTRARYTTAFMPNCWCYSSGGWHGAGGLGGRWCWSNMDSHLLIPQCALAWSPSPSPTFFKEPLLCLLIIWFVSWLEVPLAWTWEPWVHGCCFFCILRVGLSLVLLLGTLPTTKGWVGDTKRCRILS